MKPLPLKEKEYRLSLHRTERRAIIPIKWIILAISAGVYLILTRLRDGGLVVPDPAVIVVFILYMIHNAALTWAFYFGHVSLDNVRQVTLFSYLMDVIYVTVLVYFELNTYSPGSTPQSSFYILYFLLVMRGFALFRTVVETILVNALISLIFILTLRIQVAKFDFVTEPQFAAQLVLVWAVVLIAWFIMVVLNQQKIDLVKANEQLGRAENLARVGELSAIVAHEINNPLGIIIATTEYLKKTLPPEDAIREDIEAISRESHRCKDTIEHMLTYANPKPMEVALVDPRVLNDEVLQFIFPKNRSGDIEIVREYEENIPLLKADPNLLKQALLNLYINAKQAIPKGRAGKIVSRVYNGKHPPRVTFEIQDDGTGIKPEDIQHVFEPFFTRKPKGTGLGLSITQRIVESFGGDISLDPAEPNGTVVRIEFPAAKP